MRLNSKISAAVYLFSICFRNINLARLRRTFTLDSLILSASAVSAALSPVISLNEKTRRIQIASEG